MAEGKNSILVYRDWINIFDDLEDDEAGRLIKHFFRYVNDTNPEPPDRLTALLFKQIQATLKRDLKKWEDKSQKNRDNALLRWHKDDANASERKKRNAKHADSVSDSDSDSEINNIYSLYPSKCPINNSSTGKSKKNKDKIDKLLKEYSFNDLQKRIEWYIADCKKHNRFIKNFGTFLNNLPDIEESKPVKATTFKCTYGTHIKRFDAKTEKEAKELYNKNFGVYPETTIQI